MNIINKFKSIIVKKWGHKVISLVCATSLIGTILAPMATVQAKELDVTLYPSFNSVVDQTINEKTETLKVTKSGDAWKNDVSGIKPGDTVSFYVYYHNGKELVISQGTKTTTLPTIAYNTKLRVDVPAQAVASQNGVAEINATAYVWADNSMNYAPYDAHNPEGTKYATDLGKISVNSQNPVKFSFVDGSIKWYPDVNIKGYANPVTTMANGQNGSEILSEAGLNIGDIQSCWDHRGVVTFKMKVDEVLTQKANLLLTKSVDKQTAEAGDTLIYKIYYENDSDVTASAAKITDTLSNYIDRVSDVSQSGTVVNKTIAWNLGDLSAHQKGSVSFKAILTKNMPEGTTRVANTARIEGANFDPKNAVATTLVTYLVPIQTNPDLHIKKYVSKDGSTWLNYNEDGQVLLAAPGETLSYKVLVWNTGDGNATSVKVEDDVTAGNTNYYVNISPFDGNYGTVSTSNNSELSAISHTFTVDVNPAGFPLGNTEVRNVARIVSNDQNNQIGASSSTKTSIIADVALTLAKQVDKEVVQRNDEVAYTLTYGNLGNGIASGVILEDNLPTNITYIDGSASGNALYSSTEHKLIWNIGTLGSDVQNITQTFRAKVSGTVQNNENIVNTSQLSASGTEPISAQANSIVFVPDNNQPNIERSKTASVSRVNPGEEVTFTIITRNTGNVTASGVIVEDNLADVLEYSQIMRVTGSGILGQDMIMRWPSRNILAGSSLTYIVTVKVNNAIPAGKGNDYTMTNTYGNTVSVGINVPTVLPPTGIDSLLPYAIGTISLTGIILSGWKYLEEKKKLKELLKQEIAISL